MVVTAALQEDVDVIGLSILSGAHNAIVPRVMELLRQNQMDDVLVLVGGGLGWTARDRAARQATLVEKVTQALDEAQVFCRRDRLVEAAEAVKRAEALLADGGGGDELRRRVGRDLVIVNRDSIDPHSGEFGLANGAGSGLRHFAEQGGQCSFGIRRIGVDRHRRDRLDLADKARLLRLLVEFVRRVAGRVDDNNYQAADFAVIDCAENLCVVVGSDQGRTQ